ncbi:hypothetical protein JCM19232_5012 [Vibrio ishigakensis]|uniref:Uncharacterized protein n=1 Tax=Vibrio ishigakensis TaxID=1481914 RepID=A0A0B8PLB5_9VIBR|nr:hypothetical protein JCM19232_5012 [Vibrio ishigakensis]
MKRQGLAMPSCLFIVALCLLETLKPHNVMFFNVTSDS